MKSIVQSYSERYYTFLMYSVAVIGPLLSLFALFLTKNTPYHVSPFLLLLPSLIVSAWYGGIKTGMLSTGISALGSVYFTYPIYFPFSIEQIVFFLETGIFALEGAFLSVAIEYYKKSDQQAFFRHKERTYQEFIKHLEEEKSQAQKEVKARDEFLSIASHELRTPLTSMVLQLQTALHSIRNVSLANFSVENLMKMLESTENQSKRLTKMINDLLNVSLVTTGRFDLELEKTDLKKTVEEVIINFSEKLKRDGIKLTYDAKDEITIHCDKVRIQQVITNLISNAIKYGGGKPIEIIVQKQNKNGIIVVADHGIGIPSNKQDIIFGRFKRAVLEPHYKGLGVGLYISQQIVNAHDGSISLKSKPNEGSRFTVTFPLNGPSKRQFN